MLRLSQRKLQETMQRVVSAIVAGGLAAGRFEVMQGGVRILGILGRGDDNGLLI
jgi:hypothetical protein